MYLSYMYAKVKANIYLSIEKTNIVLYTLHKIVRVTFKSIKPRLLSLRYNWE